MSKQSEAKEKQGYTRAIKNCGNCKNFTCDIHVISVHFSEERNKRCAVGGFAVHKTATCNIHMIKE